MTAIRNILSKLKYAHGIFRADDHGDFASFYQKTGWFWGCLYLVFFFICRYGMGYEENFGLRLIGALLFLSFTLVLPKTRNIPQWSQLYIDICLAFTLPFLFVVHLIENHNNVYWTTSMLFAAMAYGLFARSFFSVPTFPLLTFGTAAIMSSKAEFADINGTILIATTISLACGMMRAFAKHYLHELIVLRELHKRDEVIRMFVSKSLLREIDENRDPREFQSVKLHKSVLMTDIVGYTDMSENERPEVITSLLNEYFDTICEGVFSSGGEVNKYIGDAYLCFFDDAGRCLEAAVKILKRNEALQRQRQERGEKCYRIAIGISYGEVTLGNFGAREKLDRTIIGDTVNACKRIESLTRAFGCELLASAEFIGELEETTRGRRLLTKTLVKGKAKPIDVYEIYVHQSLAIQERKNRSADELRGIAERPKSSPEDWEADFERAVAIVRREEGQGLSVVRAEKPVA